MEAVENFFPRGVRREAFSPVLGDLARYIRYLGDVFVYLLDFPGKAHFLLGVGKYLEYRQLLPPAGGSLGHLLREIAGWRSAES